MKRLLPAALLLLIAVPRSAGAAEWPSILVANDMFCQSEADFDEFTARGKLRPNSSTETCIRLAATIRVAVLNGRAGQKSMVRVMSGAMAYTIGWTNSALPIVR